VLTVVAVVVVTLGRSPAYSGPYAEAFFIAGPLR